MPCVGLARQRIGELEQILLSEIESGEQRRDKGRDTTGLLQEFGPAPISAEASAVAGLG
ncbi:MAG: hypothetical protein ABIJ09_21445 [Pseudomonadota bacterium]